MITDYIRSGDYYDAVSHSDAVYRVLRHLEEADPRFDACLWEGHG